MIYLSPMGTGFFLFFQSFQRENAKEEVAEFDLFISREKNVDLEVVRTKTHSLSITRLHES